MTTIELDGFTGSLLASESILDGTTILHGPGGCRSLPMSISTRRLTRTRTTAEGAFYFHNTRIPCTYIDAEDYIYGAAPKIGIMINHLKKENPPLITIVESPGASLIGDCLIDEIQKSNIRSEIVVVENPSISKRFSTGFDDTLTAICKKIVKKQEHDVDKINLVGLPFTSRGYEFVIEEIGYLLGLMDLELTTCIGSGSTLEQLKESSKASYNVAVFPEYSEKQSELFESSFEIPTIISADGAPVGFDAVRSWFSTISDVTGKDANAVMRLIDKEEGRTERIVKNNSAFAEYNKYKTYSISAETSLVLPLMKWLTKTFMMAPESIEITEPSNRYQESIEGYLEGLDYGSSLTKTFGGEYSDIVFGSGTFSRYLKERGMCIEAFDVKLPNCDYMDLMPKSILGIQGCRMMLDRIYNARRSTHTWTLEYHSVPYAH